MQVWLRISAFACLLLVSGGFTAFAHAGGAVDLRWWQLAPLPPMRDATHEVLRKIAARRPMTRRLDACVQPSSDLMITYDGARVTISGFPVPLGEGRAKPFLLVPFAGACDRFPPRRNQVILVIPAQGCALNKFDDPVVVTGVLRAQPAQTKLGEAGYRLTAETIAREQ
jgi:hypothetical protein